MSTERLITARVDPDEASEMDQSPGRMGVSKIKLGFIFGIGLIAIILGLTGGYFWSAIFSKIFTRELVLSETSTSFGIWKETPIPMYLKIYMFNWTNSKEFSKTVKPHFDEKGPYVFKEVDYKANRIWNKNSTITFHQKKVWHFVESMSNGSLDDHITNLNPVAATVNYIVRQKIAFMRRAADGIMKVADEGLTVTKTVRELLFDGYNDKLLDLATKTKLFKVPYDKFGWFYTRNNSLTYDGTFTMFTGEDDMSKLGLLSKWNYSNRSTIYPGTCGVINGSLGDLWPGLENSDTALVFAPDACTSVNLHHNGTSEHQGLTGKKFVSTALMLDNGTNVPSRSCYCQGIECQPSGLLNVSECKFGAPAFLSSPHFYLADQSYRDAVDNMHPNKEKHEFVIVIEPKVGIPLQVKARLQLNLLIEAVEHIKLFENLPKTFMPMLWFEQSAELTSTYSTPIKFLLILPTLGLVTLYGIAGIGLLLLVIGGVILERARRRADDNQRLIIKSERVIPYTSTE